MNNLQRDSYTSQYDELFGRAGFSTTHSYLLDQIAPASKILELGPASGYMTKILADRNCIIDAIELNPHDAEKAAQYCRKMVVGSLEDAEVFAELPGPYEVVLMADVLEHLRAPEAVLRAVRPRLSPGGMALVSLPNIAYWQMRLALLRGRFEYTDTGLLDRTHVRFFTLKTAREMFTQTGFRVAHVAVTPPTIPRFGKLKERVKRAWPTLFSINFIFHLRRDDT
jgi:2-polyprenyl-3-methyl-5-hydroxy-6-metoxy-1,4-benzoquinol methylase